MGEKSKKLIIGVVVAVAIILLVYFLVIPNTSPTQTKGDALNKITLTQDNFVYVESSYLNGAMADQSFCEKRSQNAACGITTEKYTPDMPCPETDIFDLYIKPINLEFPEINNINCKIYDGSNIVTVKETDINGIVSNKDIQHLGVPQSTGVGHITLFLDYMKPHSLMACCKIDETHVADVKMTVADTQSGKTATVNAGETYGTISNELCLPKIDVKPVC